MVVLTAVQDRLRPPLTCSWLNIHSLTAMQLIPLKSTTSFYTKHLSWPASWEYISPRSHWVPRAPWPGTHYPGMIRDHTDSYNYSYFGPHTPVI